MFEETTHKNIHNFRRSKLFWFFGGSGTGRQRADLGARGAAPGALDAGQRAVRDCSRPGTGLRHCSGQRGAAAGPLGLWARAVRRGFSS
jgi:hypothetical protein